jgi:predicted DNA-binding transcriptional regulator AlpA
MQTSNNTSILDAQKEFDDKYITASEVMQLLDIDRSVLLYARNHNKLPAPISANGGRVLLWERKVIQPYLDNWKKSLQTRRGER